LWLGDGLIESQHLHIFNDSMIINIHRIDYFYMFLIYSKIQMVWIIQLKYIWAIEINFTSRIIWIIRLKYTWTIKINLIFITGASLSWPMPYHVRSWDIREGEQYAPRGAAFNARGPRGALNAAPRGAYWWPLENTPNFSKYCSKHLLIKPLPIPKPSPPSHFSLETPLPPEVEILCYLVGYYNIYEHNFFRKFFYLYQNTL